MAEQVRVASAAIMTDTATAKIHRAQAEHGSGQS